MQSHLGWVESLAPRLPRQRQLHRKERGSHHSFQKEIFFKAYNELEKNILT